MRRSTKMGIAASLAALAIAIPAAIHLQQAPEQAVTFEERLASTTTAPASTTVPVPAPTVLHDQFAPASGALPAISAPTTAAPPPARKSKALSAGNIQFDRGLTREANQPPSRPFADMLQQRTERSNPAIVHAPGLGRDVEQSRDQFAQTVSNPVKSVVSEPVSTFSIDVDTVSYSFVRRALNAGRLPPKDAVRVEEMINYFPYAYPLPEDRSVPFKPTVTVMPSPWNPANKLLHVAIKGYGIPKAEASRANLVFLIDTSGSMEPEDRLPLVRNALRMFVDTLRPDDTVGIVTYAGNTNVALEPTPIGQKRKVIEAIDRLHAGGSTAGAAGIQEAYRMAEAAFDKAAVNRVILATDGDFNVGITSVDELKNFVERKRNTGIYLSVLGVGRGNFNDRLLQALAQNGNGVAAYIDTLSEARKTLVEEASSALFPIANDVKIQVEFNPARVAEYRLIGYETRLLRREDFSNDKVDAGDIGSGHAVTAIYEMTPIGSPRLVDDLRYAQPTTRVAAPADAKGEEYGLLRIRYKLPKEDKSRLIEFPVTGAMEAANIGKVAPEVRFGTAVAGFGQLLRSEPYLKDFGYDDVIALAAAAKGDDPFGYRAEFINLVRLAKSARP